MMRLAKNEIHIGHYIPLEEIIAGLMQIIVPQVQEMAHQLCQPENCALALLGPIKESTLFLDF